MVLYAVISATSYYRFRGSTPFEIARGMVHGSYGLVSCPDLLARAKTATQLVLPYAKIQAESGHSQSFFKGGSKKEKAAKILSN